MRLFFFYLNKILGDPRRNQPISFNFVSFGREMSWNNTMPYFNSWFPKSIEQSQKKIISLWNICLEPRFVRNRIICWEVAGLNIAIDILEDTKTKKNMKRSLNRCKHFLKPARIKVTYTAIECPRILRRRKPSSSKKYILIILNNVFFFFARKSYVSLCRCFYTQCWSYKGTFLLRRMLNKNELIVGA